MSNINLGAISLDIELMEDGMLDVWLSHEGSSGEHYQNVTPEYVGRIVAEDIECIAEGNGYNCTTEKEMAEKQD